MGMHAVSARMRFEMKARTRGRAFGSTLVPQPIFIYSEVKNYNHHHHPVSVSIQHPFLHPPRTLNNVLTLTRVLLPHLQEVAILRHPLVVVKRRERLPPFQTTSIGLRCVLIRLILLIIRVRVRVRTTATLSLLLR